MSVVPLSEVKIHLNMLNNANDTELQRFVDAAETAIGHLVGPLATSTITETVTGGTDTLVLRVAPVVSLTSLTYDDTSTVTLTDVILDSQTGIVRWGWQTTGLFSNARGRLTVVYVAGWNSALPEDLRHAVKELVRHLWETQRANNSSRPGYADTPPVPGASATWPTRVQELVQPYRTLPMVG